jgi:hypothetical protein
MKKLSAILVIGIVLSFVSNVFAAGNEARKVGAAGYSPYVKGYPQRVFFGDTHVHTAISNDAFGAGNTLGPEEAYRFARSDEIVTSHGECVRICY